MTTAKDIMDQFIYRAKNLQEFTINTTVPDNFRFNGQVPFDLTMDLDKIEAKVYALDFEEACKIFNDWLETCQ